MNCDVPDFLVGDIVYHKCNRDFKGIVCRISCGPGDCYLYNVSWNDLADRSHYGIELTTTRPPPDLDLPYADPSSDSPTECVPASGAAKSLGTA